MPPKHHCLLGVIVNAEEPIASLTVVHSTVGDPLPRPHFVSKMLSLSLVLCSFAALYIGGWCGLHFPV